jgi:hypothetical protein
VPQGQPLADALKSPEPTRLIKELINERINELRPATQLADVTDEMNAKLSGIEERFKTLNTELKLRPPVDRVAELEKANKSLESTIGGLKKRLEDLEKKG